MNNILVDNIILNNEEVYLEDKSINKIISNGKCTLNLFNCNIVKLDIIVNDNSSLIINYFNLIDESNNIININTNNNSNIIFNYSFKVINKYNLDIITNFLNNNSNITINIKGLNDSAKVKVNIDGYVKRHSIDNILNENMKLININDGISISNPNMYIDTSKVIANHNTTIGNIREDELFYFMSKGIDRINSIKLITKGFLISNFNNELSNKIKDIL